jgi:hypothetical protein
VPGGDQGCHVERTAHAGPPLKPGAQVGHSSGARRDPSVSDWQICLASPRHMG